MNRLEALIDAIADYNGSRNPEHPAYQARNPLLLKEFRDGKTTGHIRRFPSWLNGYQSAIYDVKIKCSGKSRAKLEDSTIKSLIRVYCLPDGTAMYVARFLRRALQDQTITETTPLSYFVEETHAG